MPWKNDAEGMKRGRIGDQKVNHDSRKNDRNKDATGVSDDDGFFSPGFVHTAYHLTTKYLKSVGRNISREAELSVKIE